MPDDSRYALAFDTSNEAIALGLGRIRGNKGIETIYSERVSALRQSNTQLLPKIDVMFEKLEVRREQLACVCVGRGPGSFTGVRIAIATAKGIASALGIGLVGVSTQGAVAQGVLDAGFSGRLLVASDAMRKEIYPSFFMLDEDVGRLTPDRVVKASDFVDEMVGEEGAGGAGGCEGLLVAGDALLKYEDVLGRLGKVLPEGLWTPTGKGLLSELERLWRNGEVDPLDAKANDPIGVLPIYTRLSDAEESERKKLSSPGKRNLITGVQGNKATGAITQDMAPAGTYEQGVVSIRPMDVNFACDVARMEAESLGSDAWNEPMVADDLVRSDRSWWMAVLDGELVGYAGIRVSGDIAELLKIVVAKNHRGQGLALRLLDKVAEDAFNLASTHLTLEVREGNAAARSFYESAGFQLVGMRPGYYSDGEDAAIYSTALPLAASNKPESGGLGPHGEPRKDDPGMAEANLDSSFGVNESEGRDHLSDNSGSVSHAHDLPSSSFEHPLILAIESSCDETAASVIDGNGRVLSDVVSSQIDFHARFGGVVPEIASRKHVEAIVGVCRLALEKAFGRISKDVGDSHENPGDASFSGCADIHTETAGAYSRLDAIAVTYAPGLVGALVVGVAFAKGAGWARNIPLISVNHLEGHLYANKLSLQGDNCDSRADLELPAVVSLVSGGNTMLVLMRDWHDYKVLGATIDDAVGEAFDKVAKALGFPYPGGPEISRLAEKGDSDAIDFPRALMHSGDYRFSLSGLKTAVITYISQTRDSGRQLNLPDICASFEQAVIDVQVGKARAALLETGAKTFCLGGGVAANKQLRHAYEEMCRDLGVSLVMPPLCACGDNAAMIALVALDRFNEGKFSDISQDAYAHADLEEPY